MILPSAINASAPEEVMWRGFYQLQGIPTLTTRCSSQQHCLWPNMRRKLHHPQGDLSSNTTMY